MILLSELANIASDITVLYAEDNSDIRENVVDILESIFKNVLVAHDGIEGIEISKRNNIDFVISDILMPNCNGLEMVREIKVQYPQIPVILLTGFDNPEYLLESIDLSINKYILKPIKKEKLFIAIEEVLYIIESRKKEHQQYLDISKNFKMISIARLLNNLSHQWRNSLSIVSTSLNSVLFMENTNVNDKEVQELLLNAESQILKMDKVLTEIFSEHNDMYRFEKIDLFAFFHSSLKNYKSILIEKHISVNINISDEITVSSHKDSMCHIINNIIENSIDAISSKNIHNGYIDIKVTLIENELVINIIDNGGGIDNFIKEEIFEPYATTKHNFIGTGLGLYIVYTLVTKALKGTIHANNVVVNNEKCTKMTIILPIKNETFL